MYLEERKMGIVILVRDIKICGESRGIDFSN